jgi:hypothetical protein
MAAFSPDADWTFRVFFSILHLVKAPSKILALLGCDLSEEQASQKLGKSVILQFNSVLLKMLSLLKL